MAALDADERGTYVAEVDEGTFAGSSYDWEVMAAFAGEALCCSAVDEGAALQAQMVWLGCEEIGGRVVCQVLAVVKGSTSAAKKKGEGCQ